jgi:hypothetical protein
LKRKERQNSIHLRILSMKCNRIENTSDNSK